MANENKWKQKDLEKSPDAEAPQTEDMTLEEARAYRAALYKPEEVKLGDAEKREEFRKFWAQQKYKYGKSKDLEPILWMHLKATKQDSPAQFEQGIAHFGLKKVQ